MPTREVTMSMKLYELVGRSDIRYSLFSWRSRMAVAHKGLTVELRPVRITDKEAIAFSGQDKVPILVDGASVVCGSWRIAEHLETAYADRPSLFGGDVGHGLARVVNAWVDRQLVPGLVPLLMIDAVGCVDDADAAHLRRTIETAFGRTLEALAQSRQTDIGSFRRLLDPARAALRAQGATPGFLSGVRPAYADYVLFSLFQWARMTSAFDPLEPGDALSAWRERMLDLHGGAARAAVIRDAPSA